MPKATRSDDTHRHELKSVEGGYVIARRLSYGEKQRRMQIAGGQSVTPSRNNNGQPDKIDVTINAFDIQFYDFSHCIVEHNLTKDAEDKWPINFKSIQDFEQLEDSVGREIEEFLDEINNEGDLESFRPSDGSSNSKEPVDTGAASAGIEDTGTS